VKPFVDGGCFAGHHLPTGESWSIDDLLGIFDRYGVASGVVGSYRSIYQDLRAGNEEAARWGAEHPDRVIPLAIVHPAYYGSSPESLVAWLRDDLGFKVLGLVSAPSYYPIDWTSPVVRSIGEAAAEAGLVLQAGVSSAAELHAVANSWGSLGTTVMVRWLGGHRYAALASELLIAEQHPRFLFDVGNITSVGALSRVVDRIGAERLFFASNAPYHLAGPPHAALDAASLDRGPLERIRSGTLCEALDIPENTEPRAPGVLVEEGWRDLRQQPKVDIHWHPDHWNLGEHVPSPEEQTEIFDRYGYERVIALSIRALNDSLATGNAETEAWFARDPRIYGLIVVDPARATESAEQITRYAGHPRFVGLKAIQDPLGIGLDHEAFAPILAACETHALPILAHLPGVAEAARRHPEVTIVAAHGNWGRAGHLADVRNVCFDFSTGHALREETQLKRFVAAVGADRVCFGSDMQLLSPAWSLAKLFEAQLAAEDEALVLRDNAYRIFPRLNEP
jgi:predicted TIM-barrel fold metal-dependent hydrolase